MMLVKESIFLFLFFIIVHVLFDMYMMFVQKWEKKIGKESD